MTAFIIAAAGMTLFALGVLLPVLWRSNTHKIADLQQANVLIAEEQLEQLNGLLAANEISQQEYTERQTELELNLASALSAPVGGDETSAMRSRGYIISTLIAVSLPLSAYFIYREIGMPQALDPDFVAAQQAPSNQAVASIDELLPRLEAHLESTPDDLRGWRLLGVTYLRMQRYDDAQAALSKALNLAPNDVDVLLQLADAKAMSAGGSLLGEPEKFVKQALEIQPNDLRGLWLLGMLYKEQNNHEQALETWDRLAPLLGEEPEAQQEVNMLANESRVALGLEVKSMQPPEASPGQNVKSDSPAQIDTSGSAIVVNVGLSDSIKDKLTADHSVFVYAKAVSGPPMPLAVKKIAVSDLPIELILDESMAMVAGMDLSSFDSVVVGARVSLSGNPVAQSGDYFSEVQPITPGQSAPVLLSIESEVP